MYEELIMSLTEAQEKRLSIWLDEQKDNKGIQHLRRSAQKIRENAVKLNKILTKK